MMTKNRFAIAMALMLLSAFLMTACKDEEAGGQGGQQMPPTEVTVYETKAEPVEVKDTLPARVAAYRTAEIRPQVSGIIQKRLFEQGSEVTEGQALFQINVAPFEADANTAAAALKRAESTLSRARAQAKRYKTLTQENAISSQSYDDAVAAENQAAADVAEAKATLTRRQLDVEFATITSPIAGRIDQAVVTEGALANTTDTNPLATVQQIDQVFVDVKQPASQLEELKKSASANSAESDATIEILSSNGKAYNTKGKLLFSGISVDPGTGDVLARVLVPNPDRALLPGMYVMAKLPKMNIADAILVPQQSVRRDANAKPVVSVVAADGKVSQVSVTVGDVVNGFYVVLSGLKAGQQVIVEGADKVMPDVPVKANPWKQAEENIAEEPQTEPVSQQDAPQDTPEKAAE